LKADHGRTAAVGHYVATPPRDAGGQLLQLPVAQPGDSLVPQRLLHARAVAATPAPPFVTALMAALVFSSKDHKRASGGAPAGPVIASLSMVFPESGGLRLECDPAGARRPARIVPTFSGGLSDHTLRRSSYW